MSRAKAFELLILAVGSGFRARGRPFDTRQGKLDAAKGGEGTLICHAKGIAWLPRPASPLRLTHSPPPIKEPATGLWRVPGIRPQYPVQGKYMAVEPRLLANAIRALAMDAVQAANSGHPGMPMG